MSTFCPQCGNLFKRDLAGNAIKTKAGNCNYKCDKTEIKRQRRKVKREYADNLWTTFT